MPFTLAHPAAAVPLQRFGLPLSALIVGSLMPDLPYFLFQTTSRQFAHSLAGIFIFCVPVGLLVLVVFHRLLKEPTLQLLPLEHRRKLQSVSGPFDFWPLPRLFTICLALLAGALTHVVWDSFTHADGWAVRHEILFTVRIYTLPIHRILQHGGTIFGLVFLDWFYWRWWRSAPETEAATGQIEEPVRRRWIIAATTIFLALTVVSAWGKMAPKVPWVVVLRDTAIPSMSVLLIEWLAFCVWWRLRARRQSDLTSCSSPPSPRR